MNEMQEKKWSGKVKLTVRYSMWLLLNSYSSYIQNNINKKHNKCIVKSNDGAIIEFKKKNKIAEDKHSWILLN